MRPLVTKPFPYFVGVYSLEELVTRKSRVCVINILGNESRKVTPVSHEYSGGNVVAGVQYGRHGVLETGAGDIPVYHSVRDVMKHGHDFDIGVIYLPPAAVSQAVWELVRFNSALKRIVIVTEKVSTRDSRNIRDICQSAGVDVIGANCLGVANAWDHVRVGGALGGDHPEETLRKGTVAIHSNSGNFTSTIAEYLKVTGFGITTAVSSGKDVYVHFALPEFLYAAQNDTRTKAVALYVEPGGYYEKMALDWIQARLFGFSKPMVVCVTGRWKKNLERACGHAGAMAGFGSDAESKEKWFDEYFGVPVFDPAIPRVSKKGVRISSLQHFPDAMRAVYAKIDEKPDFEASGDLSLKLWISDSFFPLPPELDLPVVRAIPPYDQRIQESNRLVGAHFLRQNMRHKSGASRLNPVTQVAELHGVSVLELSRNAFEDNVFFSLTKVMPSNAASRVLNRVLSALVRMQTVRPEAFDEARRADCAPNAFLASVAASIGDPPLVRGARSMTGFLIDLMREHGITEQTEKLPDEAARKLEAECLVRTAPAEIPEWAGLLEAALDAELPPSPVTTVVRHISAARASGKAHLKQPVEFAFAAVLTALFWKPMLEKRISRDVTENAIAFLNVIAALVRHAVIDPASNTFWKGLAKPGAVSSGSVKLTDTLFRILFSRKPADVESAELQTLLGLTVTNGPGTLSAMGAKESVSARNAIPTAFAGFLTNTGMSHGGNGFEAVEFLIGHFMDSPLRDPGDPKDPADLRALASSAAKSYFKYKQAQKALENPLYKRIPCVNHPVFKGKDVNIDPREDFIRKEMASHGGHNAFLEFYHHLVRELFNEGATENVFCVNVDAVLACVALKLMWTDLREKRMTTRQAQDLVFILFLLGRAVGTAAEIADHRDRGEDMDCRTPQNEVAFVL